MRSLSLLRWKGLVAVFGIAALAAVLAPGAGAAGPPKEASFPLFVNAPELPCLAQSSNATPSAKVTVKRGDLNDTLELSLAHFKPGLAFDLFTVERSNQDANGGAVANFKNFGLAWYQSDVEVSKDGTGHVKIRTILLDQIFGFDGNTLEPTNTFHVGFWFNDPADAAACGFTGFTPFNGEHHAGPLAFITRPNAQTDLGPLCTEPETSGTPATCKP